jgi:hypothetical protein
MGAAGIRGVDAPDRSAIPLAPVLGTFFHGFVVVAVLFALREHEEIFVRASGPILYAFRHRVRLVPDDVAAEEPAIVLQCECESPRDSEQILVFETRRIVGADVHRAVRVFFVGCSPSAVAAGVTISDVQPQDSVGLEHALHVGEDRRQRLDESSQSGFETDLTFDSVVPQTPIGWRRHHALH